MNFNDLSELTSRDVLGNFMEKHCPGGTGVEVGVLNGENSRRILDGWKSGTLYMCDTWGRHDPVVFKEASETKPDFIACYHECEQIVEAFPHRTGMIPLPSIEAIQAFKPGELDMVYIDACHNFCSVISDAMAWWTRLKSGGLIGFHDATYQEPPNKEVQRALQEWNKMIGLSFTETQCSSAWFVKP